MTNIVSKTKNEIGKHILAIKLIAITLVTPAIVFLTYAYIFSPLKIPNPLGIAAGVLGSGLTSFNLLNKTKSLRFALICSTIIAAVVLYLSMFLLLNILGA